ncbi:cupin domain-containing protein [Candidatus Aerophobetes bacterium]|nr:cupin domain-containing protein [Candidatus Aerophobetes bacterium]
MYAKRFEDTKFEEHYGNEYNMLLPKEMTESLELALVKVKKNSLTPKHTHEDEEQVYIILKGKGLMRINNEEQEVEGGMIVYIPRKAEHEIKNIGEDELTYIYVANWPSS